MCLLEVYVPNFTNVCKRGGKREDEFGFSSSNGGVLGN